MKDFADRLQELMNEHDWKPVDVVERSKAFDSTPITKTNMSQWLHRVHEPDADKIYTLSLIFGVNPNYFMGNTDVPEYDMNELAKKEKICDLMYKCYGKEAYELVKMYLSLNDEGKTEASKRITELTQLQQYTAVKRDSKKMA